MAADDVLEIAADEGQAHVSMSPGANYVEVDHDAAPAVALAILEAAGWQADALGGPVEHAVRGLAKHVETVKAAEEEEARLVAELEAEKEREHAAEAVLVLRTAKPPSAFSWRESLFWS